MSTEPTPSLAARRRAVRAVFDMYTYKRAPFYVYGEVGGLVDRAMAETIEEAQARAYAIARMPGEIYAAVFQAEGPNWPGPVFDIYHPPVQAPSTARADVAGVVNGRGSYGRPSSHRGSPRALGRVGGVVHLPSDKAAAVKQLDTSWNALFREVGLQVGELGLDASSSSGIRPFATQAEIDELKKNPKYPSWRNWFDVTAGPTFKAWVIFRRDQLGTDSTVAPDYQAWADRATTSWDTYKEWHEKLENLREQARKLGMSVKSDAPAKLPTSAVEDVEDALKRGGKKVLGGAEDAWKIVKYGTIAALGIGGIALIASVAMNVKKGRDPIEHYGEMWRQYRPSAPRAPRLPSRGRVIELPPSAVKVLPPGE